MKRFPYKLLFLSIFLPPVCYILTLQGLEGYLQNRETARLKHLLIQNDKALYEGQYTVKEEISRNIEAYVSHDIKHRLGVRMDILVKTGTDRILYPTRWRNEFKDSAGGAGFSEVPDRQLNYVEVAQENYKILSEGLDVSVGVRIRHNSWLSNGILCLYILASAFMFQRFVRRRVTEAEQYEQEQEQTILRLSDQLNRGEARLREIEAKEAQYQERITALSKEKETLSEDMDGILDEMEKLETGLEDQSAIKRELEAEASQLRDELDRVKGKLVKPKQRKKKTDATHKRFKVLYKNLTFTERAVEGFLSLTDEFQLKAEEVIHRLNEDEAQVQVKRKVFGKGGKMNVLEAEFSYSGRVYYQRDSVPGIRVLAIGTKNTQQKDLAYLESIT